MSLAITALAFVTILLLLFALFLFLAGIFTAYFGSGKSRAIGVLLCGGGGGEEKCCVYTYVCW
jgi:hypothetical protein